MRRALAISFLLAVARLAHANALDTFGFSARAEGLAGGQAGAARGLRAAPHTPARGAHVTPAPVGSVRTSGGKP